MKKIVSIILACALALCFALCFAGCGKKDTVSDNWHNTSGINRWFSVSVDGERINVGGHFTESGVELYYNDRIEKELFCEIVYDEPDANPEYTEQSLVIDDIDDDGTSELLFTFKDENGEVSTAKYIRVAEENTYKTVD